MTGLGKNSIAKALALLVLAIALCLGVLALLGLYAGVDLQAFVNNELLLPALALQLAAIATFILAWYVLLARQSPVPYSLADCSAHIGVTLISKYLPGKVWGLIGRAALMTRRGDSAGNAVRLLLTDQILTFYSGLFVIGTALVMVYSTGAGLVLVLLGLAFSPLVLITIGPVLYWLAARSRRLISRLGAGLDFETEFEAVAVNKLTLLPAFATYLLHWLVSAAVLCLLFYPLLQDALFSNCLLIIAAIPAGLLSGFVALWAPGGIGVREGVIIAILSVNLPLELATTMAISYRLLCVLNDLGTGVFAIFHLSRIAPESTSI